jgi:hypothetical protein
MAGSSYFRSQICFARQDCWSWGPSKSGSRFLIGLLLTLAALPASAASNDGYVITYQCSGTAITVTPPITGVAPSFPYSTSSSGVTATTGAVHATGANMAMAPNSGIVATLQWTSSAGNPPPPYVIVVQSCAVSASQVYWAPGSFGTVTASDGLGDPTTTSSGPVTSGAPIYESYAGSSGTHYSLYQHASTIQLLPVCPSATSTPFTEFSSAGAPSIPATQINVSYSVSDVVPTMTISGSGYYDGSGIYHAVIGQFLGATLNTGGITGQYMWTVQNGSPHVSYAESANMGASVSWNDPSVNITSQSTPQFFFVIPNCSPQISCIFLPSVGNLPPIQLSSTVDVVGPQNPTIIGNGFGHTYLVPPSSTDAYGPTQTMLALWGVNFPMYSVDNPKTPVTTMVGIWDRREVGDPPGYSGTGGWGYVQFVTSSNYEGAPFHIGLDGYYTGSSQGWPYPEVNYYDSGPQGWATANPAWFATFVDGPGLGLSSPTTWYQISCDTFIFYHPPGNGVFLPIVKFSWAGGNTADYGSAGSWTVVGPSYDSPPVEKDGYTLPLPQWNMTTSPITQSGT